MNAWKLCVAMFVSLLLTGMARAANPVPEASTSSLTLGGVGAICTGACYCPKPMPCLTCLPCDGICVQYCRKPTPCLTCLPCDGICVPYCPKPMPCICNPVVRPECCTMPSCVGVGR